MAAPDNPELPPLIPPLLPEAIKLPIAPTRGPWGFWPTTGWGAIIMIAYLAVQNLVVIIYLVADQIIHQRKSLPSIESVETNGLVLGATTILCVPPVIILCLLFAKLRNGLALRDYLGFGWPGTKAFAGWMLGLLALILASDALTITTGRPLVPEVMVDIYRNTAFKPVIWAAIILAAPLNEEFLFRGFLFRGWSESRLGSGGAVFLTAALWAVIHLQYDAYGIVTIFISGVLLGIARLKTGSMLLCIVMHAVMNLVATLQVELLILRN